RFKDNDIEVKRKDGIILLRELAAEVKNFMDFKRNAVMVHEYDNTYLNSSSAARSPYAHAEVQAAKCVKIIISLISASTILGKLE
ncbi:unnamed protein product, partial [Ceratitis capitata]